MRFLGRFVARFPRLVLVVGLLLTLLALWPASRLKLATDILDLLPDGSPAASDYRLFLEHFGGFEKVFILIEAADAERDPQSGKIGAEAGAEVLAAAERIEELLAGNPLLKEVRAGLEPADIAFFEHFVLRRAPLLLPEDALPALEQNLAPAAVRQKAAEIAASLRTPAGGVRVPLLVNDPLGLADSLDLLAAAGTGVPLDPLTSTFLTPEGDIALLILSPAVSEIDPESGHRLAAVLDEAFAAVQAEANIPLTLRAIGGPLYAAQDEKHFREDLESTLSSSAISCTLLLILVFGGLRIPLAALTGLAAALVWTTGLLSLTLGELSAVSLGFAAVLVGLGLDYGIHLGARYRQHIFSGQEPGLALEESFAHSGAGLWTSALTTSLAFASLGFAHFRPLREVGLVVGLGVVMMLVGSATVGASLWLSRGTQQPRGKGIWQVLESMTSAMVSFSSRHPRQILGAAALLSAVGLWGLKDLGISGDVTALRPANHPVFAAEEILAKRFGLGLDTSTVVVEGRDLAEALSRAAAVKKVLLEATAGRTSIVSPTDWLIAAKGAGGRLAALQQLPFGQAADELEAALKQQNLDPRGFASGLEALRAFAAGRDPGAPSEEDWPSGLDEIIHVESGRVFAALHLRQPKDLWPLGPPDELGVKLRAVAPGAAIASAVRIGAELKDLAVTDLEILSGVALLAVGLVVLLSFRFNLWLSLTASLPVLLGSCWSLGLWGALGKPLDLLSLTVVPILLGIGIDDGLHATHGKSHAGGITESVRQAGVAIFLTSATTVLGFGSLAFSSIPGLRSGGILVSLGVSACFLATVLVLPAIDAVRRSE